LSLSRTVQPTEDFDYGSFQLHQRTELFFINDVFKMSIVLAIEFTFEGEEKSLIDDAGNQGVAERR